MSPEEGKGETCNADIIPISPETQISQGYVYFLYILIVLLSPKLDQVFESLTFLRWEKNPEMSQILTIFTWLVFFLKEPNQSNLFCDIITFSSLAIHWNHFHYNIYHWIRTIWLLTTFFFILLWKTKRILSCLSILLTIAITQ